MSFRARAVYFGALVAALGVHAQTSSDIGVELSELTWLEAENVLTPESIVVLPLGAASKEHGPHLRLDNDFRMAEYLKRRVLAAADVVVAPTLSYHFYPSFLEYPGSTHLQFETSRDVVVDVVRSLAGYGPRKFYVLNTGVSTLRPLQASAEILRDEGILLHFTDILEVAAAAEEAVREQVRGTHADELETSMMLYIAPDRVDMSLAVREENPRGQGGLTRRADGAGTYSESGVWGDATLATVEKGRIIVEATVEGILRDIDALRREAIPGNSLEGSARAVPSAAVPPAASPQKIYWGDEVPQGWNGQWPATLRTVPEQTEFTRTMSTLQLHEYIVELKLASENVHVVSMFTSPLRKVAPAIVLANPRITSPREAQESGKPVVFLMGNIHPPEAEAAEALLMVARDLAVGSRKLLLDDLIVMIAPIFNVDGTDTFVAQSGGLGSETPYILGVRENSDGLDFNREGVKLESIEANGLYRTLNAWDPLLFLDGHLMGRVSHGYANTYGTTTVPAAAPAPREYMNEALFPAVRDRVRREFGLEVFSHALPIPRGWPPTGWSHDRAAWTVEAKFVVNDYGLRNRFAIITETPGQPTFERRIYAQYAYITALLEYVAEHATEMQDVVRTADEETVANVLAHAESGELRNFLDGEYQSAGKIDLLAYPTNEPAYRPGTSILGTRPDTASGPPEVVANVDDLTMPVGTRSATVPRAYLIPAELGYLADKLRAHDVEVTVLETPLRAEGEEFVIESMRKEPSRGYEMTVLDGAFTPLQTRVFPAGTYYLDMAQPMANAAFYYLEPRARDGFVGWGVLDATLRELGAENGPTAYPIFKMRRQMR